MNGTSTDIRMLVSQTVRPARLEVAAAASQRAWSAIGLLASVFVAVADAAGLVQKPYEPEDLSYGP